MWDALFAIDSTLELVDMVSIAMLLRIRWELIAAETNEAFALLLRYPEPASPAYTFIKDALYLRDHQTPQGGSEIITRHGKQAPSLGAESAAKIRASSPAPSFNSSHTRQRASSPKSLLGPQGAGLEAVLQGAAKNVFERGSQWGVGRALRDAVGEVRKNVEAYQTGAISGQTTPRSGGREFRPPGLLSPGGAASGQRPGLDRTLSKIASDKIERLEKRNKDLGKMLESAVAELWEHHREQTESQKSKDEEASNKAAMETLSLAIAKVQFVQVYLEDSSIPLPIDESTDQAATADAAASLAPLTPEPKVELPLTTIPAVLETAPADTETPQIPPPHSSELSPALKPPAAQPRAASRLAPRSRPQLTSSNFSWMLGEESASSNFASGAAHSTFASDEKRRMKGKGFLFGDDDDDDDDSSAKETKSKKGGVSGKNTTKGAKTKGKHVSEIEVEEEVIDLEDVGRRGVV